jgi:hypothetical protein
MIATTATLRTFNHSPFPPAGFSRDSLNVGAAAIGTIAIMIWVGGSTTQAVQDPRTVN